MTVLGQPSLWACPLGPAFRLMARPRIRLFHLLLGPHDGRALVPDSEEKREPVSDIDTAVADSLKALDPKRPIEKQPSCCVATKFREGPSPEVKGDCPETEGALTLVMPAA
jgi:hypothetical protein